MNVLLSLVSLTTGAMNPSPAEHDGGTHNRRVWIRFAIRNLIGWTGISALMFFVNSYQFPENDPYLNSLFSTSFPRLLNLGWNLMGCLILPMVGAYATFSDLAALRQNEERCVRQPSAVRPISQSELESSERVDKVLGHLGRAGALALLLGFFGALAWLWWVALNFAQTADPLAGLDVLMLKFVAGCYVVAFPIWATVVVPLRLYFGKRN